MDERNNNITDTESQTKVKLNAQIKNQNNTKREAATNITSNTIDNQKALTLSPGRLSKNSSSKSSTQKSLHSQNTIVPGSKKTSSSKLSSELDPTTLYLNEIGHTPLLSASEEIRLAREIAQGYENSKKTMIESNLRLVVMLAKRAVNRGLPLLDLIEEGNIGLIRAVEKFDPELDFRFSTYATWWIKQSIDRAIMNNAQTIRMPIHIIKEMNSYSRAARHLSETLGREPSDEELAGKSKISTARIAKLRNKEITVCSADTPVQNNPDKSLLDVFPDDEGVDPEKILEKEDMKLKLEEWADRLSQREADIVARRFGICGYESSTLDEVGQEVGLTRERVRQIQIEALGRLRRFMKREGLDSLDLDKEC